MPFLAARANSKIKPEQCSRKSGKDKVLSDELYLL
tara:strand:+ start:286 stop:390 length:105 start_codon:yes stop_codon:yes gene_type:complete